MKSRTTSDNSDTVGLFPFLAVLLCTMGALLVLLVVLAHKARRQAVAEIADLQEAHVGSHRDETQSAAESSADRSALAERLQELQNYRQRLAAMRAQAQKRLQDEQLRLSHVEEHTRRLEHELAKLHIAAVQLQATEENQVVDQQQAEHEVARLRELVESTRQELDDLRKEAVGQRSYAIVPYKGPNGTYRRPIYIECRHDAVIIQPEGIKLTSEDFSSVSFDAGTPLAKALRAARGLLNARAAKTGNSTPPDPYPLLLVRPDGIKRYYAVRQAVESSDIEFGYEFVNEDWSIEYPEADPELAQEMHHAVMQGRARMAMLARSAPRRYGRQGIGGRQGRHGSGGVGQSGGYGEGTNQGDGLGLASQDSLRYSNRGAGTGGATSPEGSADGSESGKGEGENLKQFGASESTQQRYGAGQNGSASMTGSAEDSAEGNSAGDSGDASSGDTAKGASETSGTIAANSAQIGSSASDSSTSDSSTSGTGSASSPGGANQARTSASASATFSQSSGQQQSLAETRGSNWANENARRGAVPIRRPIRVVVRDDRFAIMPSRHASEGVVAEGAVISLDRPTGIVMDDFATALRSHMRDWGLAGNGMYWRPVLMLSVGPNATRQAANLARLLENSGVEVRIPETAQKQQETPAHATR